MTSRRLLAFLSIVTLSTVAVACSSGESGSNRGDRNTSLSTLAPVGQTEYVSNGEGTAKGCNVKANAQLLQDASCVTVALREASNQIRSTQLAKYNLTPDVVNPVASFWTEVTRVQRAAGSAPIIARLPVSFNPAQVGIAFRAGLKESDAAWSGSTITHMSRNTDIAAATIALANRLNTMSTYKSRTVDVQKMYSALTTTDTSKIVGSGKSVSVSSGFAQLGVVPFVRMFTTEAETRQLLSEKLIAGAEMDSVGALSDTDSLNLVGVGGWTTENRQGFWSPAIENPPTGNGAIVAVSDTGILASHPAFGGRVVREGCFSISEQGCNRSNPTAVGQGAPCSAVAGCDHGTHVAGIIAGEETTLSDGTVVPRGMAPDAQLISYRTCVNDTVSPQGRCEAGAAVNGMGDTAQFIGTGANVVAYNMSHGFNIADAAVTAIAVLVAADVVVTFANGNGGNTNWNCGANRDVPGFYTVANMQKDKTPAPSTDFSSVCTDLWAPGSAINAANFAINGSGLTPGVGPKTGTSMAAPHVAGAAALIDEGLRRAATQSGTAPSSLVANFDWYAGIMAPIQRLADDRTTCSTAAGNVACTGSSTKKPLLDLRRVVNLVSPNGVSSAWIDGGEYNATLEARYRTQLRQQTPVSWTVEQEARRTSFAFNAEQTYRNASFPSPTGTVRRDMMMDLLSREEDDGTNADGVSRSGLNFSMSNWQAGRRLLIIVENGTLTGLKSSWKMTDGTRTVHDLTGLTRRIARGPMACTNAGWIEMWEMNPTQLVLSRTELNNAVGVALSATLSGPKSETRGPKSTMYFVMGLQLLNPNYRGVHTGTMTMEVGPYQVAAPSRRGPVAPQTLVSPVPQKNQNWTWKLDQTGNTDLLIHVPSGALSADGRIDSIPRIGSLMSHFGFVGQAEVRHPRIRLKHVPSVWDSDGNPARTTIGFNVNTTETQACYTVLMSTTAFMDPIQTLLTPATTQGSG